VTAMMLPILCLMLQAPAPANRADSRVATPAPVVRTAPNVPGGGTLRATLKASERTINERVNGMTDRAPFVLLANARGAYLNGYGVVFALELNLSPVTSVGLFRAPYTPQEIKDINKRKREKLGVLKAGLRQLVAEQAGVLVQIPPQEKIALVVNLFNFAWEDSTGLPSQLVVQGTRQALMGIQMQRGGPEALERAVEIQEF